MKGFAGFPDGKMGTVPVPNPFFVELLPQIDQLHELKVTLHILWRLSLKEGKLRYIRRAELHEDRILTEGLHNRPDEAADLLDDALERAVARGTLLHAAIESADGPQDFYFVNTSKGRAAIEDIQAGRWKPTGQTDMPIEVHIDRPNVFTLYEQNIGVLSPLMVDELRDAETDYPPEWIEEAIKLAVEHNKRSWSYCRAILERWRTEGKDHGQKPTRSPRRDVRRYYD